MHVKVSRLWLAGVWEWHTGGGYREPRARSGVRYPLARSASERDANDGRRSHGDTMSHRQFNHFSVQVPRFATRDTHVARSHRYSTHISMPTFVYRKRCSAIWRTVFISKWLIFFEVICIDIYTNFSFVYLLNPFPCHGHHESLPSRCRHYPTDCIIAEEGKQNMGVALNRKIYKSSLSLVKRKIVSWFTELFYWFQRENVMGKVTEKRVS
jgi:hypothetical protein